MKKQQKNLQIQLESELLNLLSLSVNLQYNSALRAGYSQKIERLFYYFNKKWIKKHLP